jgi:hypothetical protein
MVDHIKFKQKGKCIETIELCKDERLKQMDIWEDKVAMVLFVGRHWKLLLMMLLTLIGLRIE